MEMATHVANLAGEEVEEEVKGGKIVGKADARRRLLINDCNETRVNILDSRRF
jgi:hypothetical protein